MNCPKDCRIPEEEHRCFGLGLPGHNCWGMNTHQHKPKRSQAKNPPIVAILCAGLHDQLDNNAGRPWRDAVETLEAGGLIGRFYRIYRDDSDEGTRIEITDWTNEEVKV